MNFFNINIFKLSSGCSASRQGAFKNCSSRREEALIRPFRRNKPPYVGCYEPRRFLNSSWAGRLGWSCRPNWLALVWLTAQTALATDPIPALGVRVAFPALSFTRPLWLQEIPDGSKRLVVVEQDGKIFVFPRERDVKEAKVFLDITGRKPHVQYEEGLLALAFHPQFKTNGLLYIYYTQQGPKREVLSELHIFKNDPNRGDLATERVMLEIQHPYWNDNGGALVFGPDGYLYMSIGDGGNGGDPHSMGQSGHFLLAKILRLD